MTTQLKIVSCKNLQLPLIILEKSIISGMHHGISYIYIYTNFQHNRVGRSVKTVHINLFAKNRKLHKFTTTNLVIFKESIMPDMHRRKLYMYINFQQNLVSGSVKTVHIIYLQKHHKLHKFATTNSNF